MMINSINHFNHVANLLDQELPAQRTQLENNVKNLENVAKYCEDMYVLSNEQNKYEILKMTQNYTLQAVASIADQINLLASSFLDLLNNEGLIVDDMNIQLSQLAQEVKIHQEKVARREIGALTTNKNIVRNVKLKRPEVEEKPVKYLRKPIDYSILDDIGHGVKIRNEKLTRQTSASSAHSSGSDIRGAPTMKPPTPPLSIRSMTGNTSSGTVRSTASSYYRAPIAPPSVPSEYLSRQEIGLYASKKELNISDSYGAYRRPSQTSEYSGMDTLDRRMTNPYIQQLSSANTSIGYSSGKDLGIRTNLNNIDYATHGTLSRRPQLSNVIYSRSNSLQTTPDNVYQMNNNNNHYALTNGMRKSSQLDRSNSSSVSQQLRFGTSSLSSEVSNTLGLPPPPSDFMIETHQQQIILDDLDQDDGIYVSNNKDSLPNWVPADKVIEKVITVYEYEGLRDDELSFKKDTIIYVIKKNDDLWYEGIMQDEYGNIVVGLYPFNYAETVCKYNPENSNYKFNNNNKRTSEC